MMQWISAETGLGTLEKLTLRLPKGSQTTPLELLSPVSRIFPSTFLKKDPGRPSREAPESMRYVTSRAVRPVRSSGSRDLVNATISSAKRLATAQRPGVLCAPRPFSSVV